MRSNSNSKRTFLVVRNCIIPLFLLTCFGLGMFWLWSLFLLITDYSSTHSMVDAGTNNLTRTLVTLFDRSYDYLLCEQSLKVAKIATRWLQNDYWGLSDFLFWQCYCCRCTCIHDWLVSLSLSCPPSPGHLDLVLGTDLLSYTVATRAEYQSRIPWLRYKPDHRFDHLLQHPDLLQHTSLDRVAEGESMEPPSERIITDYPTYFSFREIVSDWAIADTSVEGW